MASMIITIRDANSIIYRLQYIRVAKDKSHVSAVNLSFSNSALIGPKMIWLYSQRSQFHVKGSASHVYFAG